MPMQPSPCSETTRPEAPSVRVPTTSAPLPWFLVDGTDLPRRGHNVPIRARLLIAALVFGYAWFVSGLQSFTAPAFFAVVAPGAVFVAVAEVAAERSPDRVDPRVSRFGVVLWSGVLALGLSWQLYNYLHGDRSLHPTASSLVNELTARRPFRAAVFVAWSAVGYTIARAARRA
jgi:hypothetical protein